VRRLLSFRNLEVASFTHSAVYLGLLAGWIADGPADLRTALGWTHGIGWIAMSLACIAAVRLRTVPLRVAVAVAVLGGVGPFFGTAAFVHEARKRRPGPAERVVS
jgi:hypothetical protein